MTLRVSAGLADRERGTIVGILAILALLVLIGGFPYSLLFVPVGIWIVLSVQRTLDRRGIGRRELGGRIEGGESAN